MCRVRYPLARCVHLFIFFTPFLAKKTQSAFFLAPDQDGWLGEFSGGRLDALLWKEGEIYLLPLSEEDPGFFRAPGECREIDDRTPSSPSSGPPPECDYLIFRE